MRSRDVVRSSSWFAPETPTSVSVDKFPIWLHGAYYELWMLPDCLGFKVAKHWHRAPTDPDKMDRTPNAAYPPRAESKDLNSRPFSATQQGEKIGCRQEDPVDGVFEVVSSKYRNRHFVIRNGLIANRIPCLIL